MIIRKEEIMKTEKNILVAFLLNISFSIFELIGGFFTNSIAILSDSIHDLMDAISIGISYFLERKSKKKADNKYTFGYARYSVLGGVITTSLLFVGSILVITNSIKRIITPEEVQYKGMLIFAVLGVVFNLLAAYFTKDGDSLNQRSVNLHMLEDVLGWIVVLIGSIIMNFMDIKILDPIMSIGVSLFILVHSIKNLKRILDVFLEKVPKEIDIEEIKNHLLKIKSVEDIHHIHIWSIDGENTLATMHIVTKSKDIIKLKKEIREELEEHGISHAILETEEEECEDKNCHIETKHLNHHHHH